MSALACRSCGGPLERSLVDLGASPLANDFLTAAQLEEPEVFYPLHVRICERCLLAQLPQVRPPEGIFSDYAYFSSYSDSWLAHCERFAREAARDYRLGASSLVVEIGSNDGCLLQYFARAGIPVLGVEPAANVARAAEARGVRTLTRFFGAAASRDIASSSGRADLVVGNNVLAHVPELNDFVHGLALLLKPGGTLCLEFPHLLRLIEQTQFDTIYHEHLCYFSLLAAEPLFERHGLRVARVEELPTHGGSLRVHAVHAEDPRPADASVASLRALERTHGLDRLETYAGFGRRTVEVKHRLMELLLDAKRAGRRIAAYGAAAKGNTLLNYCGIGPDLVEYVVDRNPRKQGRYLPGSRIPVHAPERLSETRPDVVLVLPWNLLDEIMGQLAYVRAWGARFLAPIPQPRMLP